MVLDLSTPEAQADPHSLFAAARRDHGPVVYSERHDAWLVLSHAGVTAAFRDPRLSADRIPAYEHMARTRPEAFSRVVDLLRGWMVFRDDPVHNRLRDPVRRAFTPRRVESLTDAIERTVDSLLADVTPGSTFDLRSVLAAPLPALVIADLLGVPGADRAEFQHWSDLLSMVVFAADSKSASVEPAIAGAEQFWSYFGALVEERRRAPGDDLVSALVAAGLDGAEAIGACTLLLFAGHETTTGLLVNGTRVLLDNPAQLARLRADPSLWATAVDELLRLEGPAKVMVRRASADIEIDGVAVPAGATVWLCILAADHDPAVFGPDADACDVGRDPNPHVAFGWGIHHCLGAPLARLEARIALRHLFERFPALAITGAAPRWGGGVIGRGIGRLELRA